MTTVKVLITGIITLFIFSLLLWDHFHGGVSSHHIFHQKALPAISNWWSGIILPILTWVLLVRIEKRLNKHIFHTPSNKKPIRRIWVHFVCGLIFALMIAVSFANDYTVILDNVIYLFIILSMIIPIFYSEFILGFVLGMSYTFGAILPTAFVLIMAGIGLFIYKYIRPMVIKLMTGLNIMADNSSSH